jgi:hypothetical protein
VLLSFGGTAYAQSKCHAGKLKCVSKKKSCLLGLESKAYKTGIAPDPLKVQKCKDKFGGFCELGANDGLSCDEDSDCPGGTCEGGCFTKLEDKVPVAPDQPCPAPPGDAPALEAKVDAFVADVLSELDPTPGYSLNLCTAGKIKCVIKKDKCILGLYAKEAQKNIPIDPLKLAKCSAKFGGLCDGGANVDAICHVDSECPGSTCEGGCFTKLEDKVPSLGCQTTGDSDELEAKVDAFDADVIDEIANGGAPGTCPTQITFEGTSTNGVLDTGRTGQGHDSTVISDGMVTVNATCGVAVEPCGVCSYSGPIDNAAGELDASRCSNDSSIHCTPGNNAPCGAGTCKFYFGSYLPLAAGGVSTCVENTFNGGISGTANIDNGSSAGVANLTSRVFSGPSLSNPCPRCDGDATANDGVQGGTCASGTRSGLACDRSGSSPNASFGPTSLDCPPLVGGLLATLPIDLTNTTGSKTRTLSAANPNCRAIGWTTNKCQCDTCNNAAATPCSSNADCTAVGATICGGRRCAGGANNGTPCAANSECPGGACSRPGAATAANQCDLGSGDCVADAGTPSPNDRICSSGPFEQFCSPVELFRGCTSNADCNVSCGTGGACGDTCSFGKNRDCFDNGTIGEVVNATGNADPPSGHQSDPTLASLFCIGPTSSGAVNGAAGLPGLGRLELTGHAVDNGTP